MKHCLLRKNKIRKYGFEYNRIRWWKWQWKQYNGFKQPVQKHQINQLKEVTESSKTSDNSNSVVIIQTNSTQNINEDLNVE